MRKKPYFPALSAERGMALISALLLLLVVSLLAVGLSMDTSMDVRISAYQRFQASSFAFAEAGLMAASDILEENAFEGGWTNPNADPADPFPFPHLSGEYVGRVDILQDGAFYQDRNTTDKKIMEMRGDIEADISTQYVNSKLAEGSAIQVAAGYSGMGKGTGGGGGHILYNLEGTGMSGAQGDARATTDLGLNYRFVTK